MVRAAALIWRRWDVTERASTTSRGHCDKPSISTGRACRLEVGAQHIPAVSQLVEIIRPVLHHPHALVPIFPASICSPDLMGATDQVASIMRNTAAMVELRASDTESDRPIV